jgi:hypothetical protein
MECIKNFILELAFMINVEFILFNFANFDCLNKITNVYILPLSVLDQDVNQLKKREDAMEPKNKFQIQQLLQIGSCSFILNQIF